MRYYHIHPELTEATRPYVKKTTDPALMTWDEYRTLVDPDDKSHPSSAYQTTVKRMNSWNSASKYPELVNTLRRAGLVFEIRKQTQDRYDGRYVKTTPDGEVVRDSDGKAQYLSQQEIAQLIPADRRYTSEYAVVEKSTGLIVATTSDEWGTVLVQTAEEYRDFGFGTLLAKMRYTDEPDKPSGGFTPAGLATMRRVHAQMVRDYQQSGMYSSLVKQGVISAQRAREIINSVRTGRTKPSKLNLDTTDPAQWLLLTDSGQSYAILYDQKIYDLPEKMLDQSNHWANKMIIAMVTVAGTQQIFVNRTYGPPRIQSLLLEVMLNAELDQPVVLEPDQYNWVKRLEPALQTEKITDSVGGGKPRTQYRVQLTKPTLHWQTMAQHEQQYRKNHDKYDEMYVRILEMAEALAD